MWRVPRERGVSAFAAVEIRGLTLVSFARESSPEKPTNVACMSSSANDWGSFYPALSAGDDFDSSWGRCRRSCGENVLAVRPL